MKKSTNMQQSGSGERCNNIRSEESGESQKMQTRQETLNTLERLGDGTIMFPVEAKKAPMKEHTLNPAEDFDFTRCEALGPEDEDAAPDPVPISKPRTFLLYENGEARIRQVSALRDEEGEVTEALVARDGQWENASIEELNDMVLAVAI